MLFITALAAAAAAVVGATNTVTFVNQDDTDRTVYFTPNAGLDNIDEVEVTGGNTKKVTFPQNWLGNFYAVSAGCENVAGMLGEVSFNGWKDLTYFDVSAIVNATDTNGVQELFPASEMNSTTKSAFSGCSNGFPCNTVYIQSDDVQTVSTSETDLVCTLGAKRSSSEKRNENDRQLVARNFVLGKLS